MPKAMGSILERGSSISSYNLRPRQAAAGRQRARTTQGSSSSSSGRGSNRMGINRSATASTSPPAVGERVPSTGDFATTVRLHDGSAKTLKVLLDESENGLVIWTFKPKDEDDAYDFFRELAFAIFDIEHANLTYIGLTTSSVAANSSLRDNKEIDFSILSDPRAKLIGAMGYRDARRQVKRGVFVVAKDGTLLLRRTSGSIINIAEAVYKTLAPIARANRPDPRLRGGVLVPW